MSRARPKARAELKSRAVVFAALGDTTRLSLVAKLAKVPSQSISRLAGGSTLTRQAVTKHLRVLENAGIVHSVRRGRENVFAFRPGPLEQAQSYLERVSDQWDDALARLKTLADN